MLTQLRKLDFCDLHECIHLVERALEVLDAERVDCDDLDAGFVAYLEYLVTTLERHSEREGRGATLASASKPMLWPSTVSMWLLRANRRLPSMTNAMCWGTGPCRRALMRSSCVREIAHSIGGLERSHLRVREEPWSVVGMVVKSEFMVRERGK